MFGAKERSGIFEKSVAIYEITRRRIPEDAIFIFTALITSNH
jgi:hypothetical protein